jgi:hypothetical protein
MHGWRFAQAEAHSATAPGRGAARPRYRVASEEFVGSFSLRISLGTNSSALSELAKFGTKPCTLAERALDYGVGDEIPAATV